MQTVDPQVSEKIDLNMSAFSDHTILKLKQKRRVIDQDSSLLANRIALLETEEQRIAKKIAITRKRAE